MGLRRERTVVDVDVSEEKKKELLDKIQNNTDNLQKRRLSEKLRQQNQVCITNFQVYVFVLVIIAYFFTA